MFGRERERPRERCATHSHFMTRSLAHAFKHSFNKFLFIFFFPESGPRSAAKR